MRRVTLAAFLLPAGSVIPILSSLSLSILPPFFDLALEGKEETIGNEIRGGGDRFGEFIKMPTKDSPDLVRRFPHLMTRREKKD